MTTDAQFWDKLARRYAANPIKDMTAYEHTLERAGSYLHAGDKALELGAEWVHLGQEDLAEADLTAIRAGGLKLGVSTHDEEELQTALAAQPDYVALGPIYPTILKKMRFAPQGLDPR